MNTRKELCEKRQKAYLHDWQADQDDPAKILQDISIDLLEMSAQYMQDLMFMHQQHYQHMLPYSQHYTQPYMTYLQLEPSTSFAGVPLKRNTLFYIQGNESLLPIKLKEDIVLQHTQIQDIYIMHPHTYSIRYFEEGNQIPLFSDGGEERQHFALRIVFPNICKLMEHAVCHLYIRTMDEQDQQKLLTWMSSKQVAWHCFWKEQPLIFQLKQENDYLCFQFIDKFPLEEGDFTFYMDVHKIEDLPCFMIQTIYLDIPGQTVFLDRVFVQEKEEDIRCFPLADSPISIMQTCYMRCDEVFSRLGASLTWRFSMEGHIYSVAKELMENAQYHLFMRKLPKQQIIYDVYIDGLRIEYFNGEWIKLNDVSFERDFFHKPKQHCEFHLHCPSDMQPYTYDGISAYYIRLVITKSQNCYQQPAYHHIPMLKHMRWQYDYEQNHHHPHTIEINANAQHYAVGEGPFMLFERMQMQCVTMFLRFQHKPLPGPYRMFVDMYHSFEQKQAVCFLYDHRDAICELDIEDETEGFAHSGLLSFFFPEDMVLTDRFGVKGYWVMIEKRQEELPWNRITRFHSNCVGAFGDDHMMIEKVFSHMELPYTVVLECDLQFIQMKMHDGSWKPCEVYVDEKLHPCNIIYHEEEKTLMFPSEAFASMLLQTTYHVRIFAIKDFAEHMIPEKSVVFPASSMRKVNSIQTLKSSVWQSINDQRNVFVPLHHDQMIDTMYALKRMLMVENPHLWDVHYEQKGMHIQFTLLWIPQYENMLSLDVNTKLEERIREQLPDTYAAAIRIISPVRILLQFQLEIIGEDLDDDPFIKEKLHGYCDQISGRNHKGWHLGEFPEEEEIIRMIGQEDHHCQIIQLQIKHFIYSNDQLQYISKKKRNEFPNAIIQLSAVHIIRKQVA